MPEPTETESRRLPLLELSLSCYGQTAQVWRPHNDYLSLGTNPADRAKAYQHLMDEVLPVESINKIRHCLNTGLVQGTEVFRDQVAKLRQ